MISWARRVRERVTFSAATYKVLGKILGSRRQRDNELLKKEESIGKDEPQHMPNGLRCFRAMELGIRKRTRKARTFDDVRAFRFGKITPLGFEPRLIESESIVLPLHYRAVLLRSILSRGLPSLQPRILRIQRDVPDVCGASPQCCFCISPWGEMRNSMAPDSNVDTTRGPYSPY